MLRAGRRSGGPEPETAMNAPTAARIVRTVHGMPTSDGAGVKLRRVIGTPQLPDLDPFLMLDEFGTDRAEDYIAGFPIIRIAASRP